jgi:streptomycin 6-kinase
VWRPPTRFGLPPESRAPDLSRTEIPSSLLNPARAVRAGCELALRLAAEPSARVLLHGDLTPANILDGGVARGLVAIDPAPCVGDPAFDGVDLSGEQTM